MDADDIKKKMLQQIQQEGQEQNEEAYIHAQKRVLLRQVLDADARERLARIRMANPRNAEMIENQIIGLYQMGRIRGQLDDKKFQVLVKNLTPKKREIKIRRI